MIASRWLCPRSPTAVCSAGHYLKRNVPIRFLSSRVGPVKISEEVQEAVHSGKPVVALETTIYTHGFPYPENIVLSSRLESIVRQYGGIPATIGILNGVARVGFQTEELTELLSSAGSPTTVKVSRRDLGLVCGGTARGGKKANGGTTIAGTLVLAHLAGIHVFATGGLGGVHRGGQDSLDISADLTELGRTPVALISSGCKSFLDIPRTLEYLETQGVLVSTFADGRQGSVDFPAFWTRDSGVRSPATIQDEQEAAAVIHAQLSFPLNSGMLFANPIPPKSSLEKSKMDKITTEAIEEAHRKGASGNHNTPFILNYIREATKGATIAANAALVEANVRRGTLVATELAKLRLRHHSEFNRRAQRWINMQQRAGFSTIQRRDPVWASSRPRHSDLSPKARRVWSSLTDIRSTIRQILGNDEKAKVQVLDESLDLVDVVVAGSVAIDLSCDYKPLNLSRAVTKAEDQGFSSTKILKLATSNPATISSSVGGVGHNIALALHYLGVPVCFYSCVGKDPEGQVICATLKAWGLSTKVEQRCKPYRTAQYIALNNTDNSLFTAVADMSIFEGEMNQGELSGSWQPLLKQQRPKWVVLDANWSAEALDLWTELARTSLDAVKVIFEPVSIEKSVRAFPPATSKHLLRKKPAFEVTTPNEYELNAMFSHATASTYLEVIAERNQGVGPDRRSVDTLMSLFNEATARCLSSAGKHDSPRWAEVQEAAAKAIYLLRYFKTLLVKFGSSGILQVSALFKDDPRLLAADARSFLIASSVIRIATVSHLVAEVQGIYLRWYPPAAIVPADEIVSVNGVGDTFLGVLVAGLVKTDRPIEELIDLAQLGAVLTLKSRESVSEEIRALPLTSDGVRRYNSRRLKSKRDME